MRIQLSCAAIALLVLAAGQAQAQSTSSAPAPGSIGIRISPFAGVENPLADPGFLTGQEKGKDKEKEPKGKTQPPVEPPQDVFAQSAPESAEASRGLNPHTISDLPAFFTLKTVMLPGTQIINTLQNVTTFKSVPIVVNTSMGVQIVIVQVPVTTQVPVTLQRPTVVTTTTRVPILGLGAFKIGENQSPLPEDRAFLTYNYYNAVRGPSVSFAAPITLQTTFNGFPATITTAVPAAPPPRLDIHRGVFGFEKSFLDGSASFGVRVPVFDGHGDNFSQSDIGDVTVFLNYAFYRDAAGNVLSGGLAVTAPTGPRVDSVEGNIHPVFLQPFVGYRWNVDRFYLQGFTSIAVPTDSVAVTALFNDVGIGYYLYRGDGERCITALIPTVEAHVTTPLNHRHASDTFNIPDLVDLTAGMHIGLGSRSLLTVGVTTPVTGPRLWNVEAVVQFNFRF